MAGRILLFLELVAAFTGLFWWIQETSLIHNIYRGAQTALGKGKVLPEKLDRLLLYSGLNRKIPFLKPEIWIMIQFSVAGLVCFAGVLLGWGIWGIVFIMVIFFLSQYVIVSILIARNYNAVDENLLKFLDFLGNYSITSGEITSILYQISNYLDDPLRSVLQECYYEAQTFGNTSATLLNMIGKIQHPKFGEVIRNIEITMRYSADFTILVNQSRRSVREHMRMRQERKSLAKEAWVNMMILGAMTVVIFKIVEGLVDVSMKEVLIRSWVGRGCLIGLGLILLLFYRKVRAIDK